MGDPTMAAGAVIPSSPPLPPFHDAPSPTSSEPPLFSSDDPFENEDADNYIIHRQKRKRIGPWWVNDNTAPVQPFAKKTKLSRNFDSGVWLLSDDSEDLHEPTEKRTEPAMDLVEDALVDSLDAAIQCERNTSFIYENHRLEDHHLRHFSRVAQVIIVPPMNPDMERPHERQYRPMIPDLSFNLSSNNLRLLHRALFNIEHITSLKLRDNNIKELPPQIENLRNLKMLDLTLNPLEALTYEIIPMLSPQGPLDDLRLPAMPQRIKGEDLEVYREFLKDKDLMKIPYHAREFPYLTACCMMVAQQRETNITAAAMWAARCVDWWSCIGKTEGEYSLENTADIVSMGVTDVSYFDQFGALLPGSSSLPKSPDDPLFRVHVLLETGWCTEKGERIEVGLWPDDEDDVGPENTFEPPNETGSLLTTAFEKSIYHLTPDQVEEQVASIGMVPVNIQKLLDKVRENVEMVYEPFRRCSMCGKKYIVAKTEWLEYFCWKRDVFIPVKRRGCSYVCRPDWSEHNRFQIKSTAERAMRFIKGS